MISDDPRGPSRVPVVEGQQELVEGILRLTAPLRVSEKNPNWESLTAKDVKVLDLERLV
jgi:hypothetical protein